MLRFARLVFIFALTFILASPVSSATRASIGAQQPRPYFAAITPTPAVSSGTTPAPVARTYAVRSGDTLGSIAEHFNVSVDELVQANALADPDSVRVGQRLKIPGVGPLPEGEPGVSSAEAARSPVANLPARARNAAPDSPLRGTTWVTYYGRPEVPVMGILGEWGIDDLIPLLREQARAYDEANGPELSVRPAIHLIYGMATAVPGPDGSHLTYLDDEVVRAYIDRAAWEGMGVILDVQIGNVAPLQSIRPAFPYLKYKNVQLALDPEFAMTTPGQAVPGQPPGTITADQINQVQSEMVAYMNQENIPAHKMLIVHQFLPSMIIAKGDIGELATIDVVICADGYGAPWPKISKYNDFMGENVQFAGFKLFYRWDEPLMTEGQALGAESYPGIGYMQVTPSLIVYQ